MADIDQNRERLAVRDELVHQRNYYRRRADAAEAKLDRVRGWLDMEEASTREWDGKHNPECEREVAQATYEIIANVRKILDEVQP